VQLRMKLQEISCLIGDNEWLSGINDGFIYFMFYIFSIGMKIFFSIINIVAKLIKVYSFISARPILTRNYERIAVHKILQETQNLFIILENFFSGFPLHARNQLFKDKTIFQLITTFHSNIISHLLL
ncbi:hypothetical protein ACJX0J_012958, partial [Zea mays]